MFQLEIVIVIVGLRTETDLLDNNPDRFCFLLLLFFLLLVQEFLIINYSAYGWNSCGRNLTRSALFLRQSSTPHGWDKSLFYIIAYKADFEHTDPFVDPMLFFVSLTLFLIRIVLFLSFKMFILLDCRKRI